MSSLKQLKDSLFSKKNKEDTVSKNDASPVECPVLPKVVRHIGRRLSFHIDVDSIQMAAVQHTPLNKTNLLELRTAYISDKNRSDSERTQRFIDTINSFIDEFGGQRPDLSIVLSGQEVACRTIFMPELKKRDLDSAIRFEATRKLPFPLDQCVTEWRATRSIPSASKNKLQVSLLAATIKAIQTPLNLVEQDKRTVKHAFHAHDVIGQLLPYFKDFNCQRPYALLWIGRHISEISFYHGSGLEFTQVVPVGTAHIGKGPDDDQFIRFASTLGDEVQTALDYYAGQYSSSYSDAIYVYGELAYSDELLEHLPLQTGFAFTRFPVELIPVLDNQPEDVINKSLFCLPVLAAATCRAELPSLLPSANKEALEIRKIDLFGRFAIAVVLVSLMAFWGFLNQSISTRRGVLSSLERQVEIFRNSEAYHQYNQLKAAVATARSYMSQIEEEPSYLNLNLKELSKLTPKQIRIGRYNLNQHEATNLTLHGFATSSDIPPEVILAEYVENLNASPFYDNVSIRRHVKRKTHQGFVINFEIEMTGVL